MHAQTYQIAIHIYAAEAHSSLGLKVILISAAKIGEKNVFIHCSYLSIFC